MADNHHLAAARRALGAAALTDCDVCTVTCAGCISAASEAITRYHQAMAAYYRACVAAGRGTEEPALEHERHAALAEEAARHV